KHLLAFFMTLLMIVFIGGSALQGLLTPNPNPEIARSGFGPIMLYDQQKALEETKLLESIGQSWQRPLSSDAKPLESVDWILLSREAEKLGVSVDEAAVETSPGFESQMSQIQMVAHQLRVKPDLIISALARLQSIQQAAIAVAGSSVPSEAEVIRSARDALEKVSIRAVLLPAEAFANPNAEFTPEEIAAQYSAHREREKGTGLNFGYYQQPRIKVQFLKIDRGIIAANIGVPNLERKAKTYYEERRATDPAFRRSPEELNAKDPAEAGLIVGPPAPKPTPWVDWEQARDAATTKLREQFADENVQRIVDWAIPFTSEAWIDAAKRDNGYKTAPQDVASADYYDRLVERLPQTLKYSGAVTVHVTDFFSQSDASKVSDIGGTIVRGEPGLVARNFGPLAFRNEAIIPRIPEDEGAAAADYLAMYQTSSHPLSDYRKGDVYVFRVIEARPGGPAESVDQVRDQVIADLRLRRGFEAAKKHAESLRSCAANDPLRSAYESDPELAAFRETGEGAKTGFFEPPPFSRVLRGRAATGRTKDGMFVGGGLDKLSNDIVDACFALAADPQKTAVMEMPDRAAVLVVEWVETIPAGEDEFNSMRGQLVTQLTDSRWREFINDWLDPGRIRARTGFDLIRNK
ncbi:MAG: hypothetical protein Q7R41_01270, partial [Phycisphaerales bacterium]|nr:hypothetical protein [Phycisphaerales bacterium]